MNTHSLLILVLGTALALGLRLFLKSRLWGITLFLAIVGAAGSLLYWPGANGYLPQDKLTLGPDLKGGTTLVYDVLIPDGANAAEVVERTISTLSKRVDPTGTRNLVWKRLGESRLQVLMPAPNDKTAELRDAWEKARDAACVSSLSAEQLQDMLAQNKAPAGNEKVLAAYQEQTAAQKAYAEAEKTWKTVGKGEKGKLYDTFLAAEDRFFTAKKAYSLAEADALKTNSFRPSLLTRVCDLPSETLSEKDVAEGKQTRRQKALADLKSEYPARAQALDQAMVAYGAYEKVKGALETPEDLDRLIQGSGRVEFRIAPRRHDEDLGDPTYYIQKLRDRGPRAFGTDKYIWCEVDSLEQYLDINDGKNLKNGKNEHLESLAKKLELPLEGLTADRVLRELTQQLEDSTDPNPAKAAAARQKIERITDDLGVIAQVYGGKIFVLVGNDITRNAMTADQGWALKNPDVARDQYGSLCVSFQMDQKGSELLGAMTGNHVGRLMAVLLDGRILTTPNLQSKLSDGGQITGRYTQQEVAYLVNTMRAGSLEGRIAGAPVSQKTTGPELGADNLDKGLAASFWAFGVVGMFMIFYYFVPGITANIALVANLVLILGVMSLFNATFTMPGIAGMVLTIGMAVDANVLIYERIREEMGHGKDLRTAIHDGHHRSLATIFDSHVTQLLVAWILAGAPPFNLVETPADLKGFAVTLGIGILASLFTALFGAYVFLDLYLWICKPKKLHMLPTVIPGLQKALTPNIKWVQLSRYFLPITAVLCVASVGLAVYRGIDIEPAKAGATFLEKAETLPSRMGPGDLFDVEFRSGSQVGFRLKKTGTDANNKPVRKTMALEEVRESLAKAAAAASNLQKNLPVADAALANRVKPAVEAAKARHEESKKAFEAKRTVVLEPVADFSLLSAEYLIGVGANQDGKYGEFSLKTLVVDARAVTDIVQAALEGDLEAEPPVTFAGAARSAQEDAANLIPVTSNRLAEVLKHDIPSGVDADIREFVGGVAVVVDQLQPALTKTQFEDRLNRMRNQPPHDKNSPRRWKTIPLTAAAGTGSAKTWSAFAVVTADDQTSYTADQGALFAKDGLAVTQRNLIKDALLRASAFEDVTVFGSQVSGTMANDAKWALLLSFFGIAGYVWFRFNALRYGVATLVALGHDVCIALGAIALSGLICNTSIGHALGIHDFKFNLAMVAALLTVMGYSVNDTIVVFDRIREQRSKLKVATAENINDAINHTLSRTLLTSGTVIVSCLILYLVGGPAIHGFAFATLVGVLTGTWSSIAIASPLLLIGTKGKGLSMEKDESELADARLQPSAPGEPVGI